MTAAAALGFCAATARHRLRYRAATAGGGSRSQSDRSVNCAIATTMNSHHRISMYGERVCAIVIGSVVLYRRFSMLCDVVFANISGSRDTNICTCDRTHVVVASRGHSWRSFRRRKAAAYALQPRATCTVVNVRILIDKQCTRKTSATDGGPLANVLRPPITYSTTGQTTRSRCVFGPSRLSLRGVA